MNVLQNGRQSEVGVQLKIRQNTCKGFSSIPVEDIVRLRKIKPVCDDEVLHVLDFGKPISGNENPLTCQGIVNWQNLQGCDVVVISRRSHRSKEMLPVPFNESSETVEICLTIVMEINQRYHNKLLPTKTAHVTIEWLAKVGLYKSNARCSVCTVKMLRKTRLQVRRGGSNIDFYGYCCKKAEDEVNPSFS